MPFFLYKIYAADEVIYLGRTKQPLSRRLYGHFFQGALQKHLDIRRVDKIEYAVLQTEADLFLYEIYYINLLHPKLNQDDKAKDCLTVALPEVDWRPFESDLLPKWERVLSERAAAEEARSARRKVFFQEKRRMKKLLSGAEFEDWLENNIQRIEE